MKEHQSARQHGAVSSDTPTSFGVETPPTMELQPEETGLLPCPFCGNKATDKISSRMGHLARCTVCYTQTEDYTSKDAARLAWNRRAPLTSSSPQAPAATSVSSKKQSPVGQPKEQQKWWFERDQSVVENYSRLICSEGIIATLPTWQAKAIMEFHNASLGDEQKAVSETEVQRFLREYDEGKHTLPRQYVEALARSRKQLFKMVRDILVNNR